MEEKYQDLYQLKVLDYNRYDLLAPHGVLDIMQDISGKHCNTYGMTFEELLSQNKIWVLLRVKYKVFENIKLYSKVRVTTWPKKKGLVDFDRETQITDLQGNVMINGISKWVILDSNTRKIVPAKYIEYNALIPNDSLFNDRFDRIKDFNIEGLQHYHQRIEFCDVDHNGHTNNAKYACILLNALRLKEDEVIDTFQIDYVHESRLDDTLMVYYYKENKTYFAKAICQETKATIFLAKIDLKD